jgi:hypothetical protein
MDDFDLTGVQAPSRRGSWPEAAKYAVAGGAGCSVVVLLEFLLLYGAIQAMFSATLPEGLAPQLKVPARAVKGQTVPVTLVVRNQGEQSFTVRGLVVREATGKRFRLSDLKPAPATARISLFGTDTWAYSQNVAPGKSWTLQFRAAPQETGKLRGTLELQIDRGVRRLPFQIDVAPADNNPSPRSPASKK